MSGTGSSVISHLIEQQKFHEVNARRKSIRNEVLFVPALIEPLVSPAPVSMFWRVPSVGLTRVMATQRLAKTLVSCVILPGWLKIPFVLSAE